jgi:hypothetical protein
MDVRFCEGRDHGREAPTRAEDLDREVRALASAPGHVCFSLTEDWVENHLSHAGFVRGSTR